MPPKKLRPPGTFQISNVLFPSFTRFASKDALQLKNSAPPPGLLLNLMVSKGKAPELVDAKARAKTVCLFGILTGWA